MSENRLKLDRNEHFSPAKNAHENELLPAFFLAVPKRAREKRSFAAFSDEEKRLARFCNVFHSHLGAFSWAFLAKKLICVRF